MQQNTEPYLGRKNSRHSDRKYFGTSAKSQNTYQDRAIFHIRRFSVALFWLVKKFYVDNPRLISLSLNRRDYLSSRIKVIKIHTTLILPTNLRGKETFLICYWKDYSLYFRRFLRALTSYVSTRKFTIILTFAIQLSETVYLSGKSKLLMSMITITPTHHKRTNILASKLIPHSSLHIAQKKSWHFKELTFGFSKYSHSRTACVHQWLRRGRERGITTEPKIYPASRRIQKNDRNALKRAKVTYERDSRPLRFWTLRKDQLSRWLTRGPRW